MPLDVGSRLGHYDVTALIGEGGMGQVYQATDTKLNRQVALKILPEAFASDPDRLARFQREAQVLASLNHPNIAAIHGLEESEGTRALVLELVEGPTLADRIAQGPIPLDEALPIAKQIAEALEAAHEAGVIHRDLKPANIKVKDDGTVKVLDFGLAKALDTSPEGDPSQSPTLTAAATQMGVIMGTAAYMSPEQASGEATDKRSDIWSFGVVLFEMLSGQRLFTGKTVSHVLSGVLRVDPDWNVLPPATPPPLNKLLQRCLEKERTRRLRDIGDALPELEEALTASPSEVLAPPDLRRRLSVISIGAAVLTTALVIGLAVWVLGPEPVRPVSRLTVDVRPSEPVAVSPNYSDVAISRDGTQIVYQTENEELYIRAVDQLEGVPLRGAVLAGSPFLSPDGASVGFVTRGTLMKVSTLGGPAVTICSIQGGNLRGASWGLDDTIVFGVRTDTGLLRVPAAGGEPELITTPDEGYSHRWPDYLPGGRGVLFVIDPTGPGSTGSRIAVLDLETGEHRVIIPTGLYARYSPTGHIVYVSDGTLRAVAFDLGSLEVTSDPVPVVEGVMNKAASGASSFALSDNGSLLYVSGPVTVGAETGNLVWVDREGRETPLPLPAGAYGRPRLSPDGTRVAVRVLSEDQLALWVYEVSTGASLRLTTEGNVGSPVWTPDGARLIFGRYVEGQRSLDWIPADRSGPVENVLLVDSDVPNNLQPSAVVDDGHALVFTRPVESGRQEIWKVQLEDEQTAAPLIEGEFRSTNAVISPDGQWLAYTSNQSGRSEVYVQPYPGPGPTVPVSIGGLAPPRGPQTGRSSSTGPGSP